MFNVFFSPIDVYVYANKRKTRLMYICNMCMCTEINRLVPPTLPLYSSQSINKSYLSARSLARFPPPNPTTRVPWLLSFGLFCSVGFELSWSTMEGLFRCSTCPRAFGKKFNLHRHAIKCSNQSKYECDQCDKIFTRKDSRTKHMQSAHESIANLVFACGICSAVFKQAEEMRDHRREHINRSEDNNSTAEELETGFVTIESAHNRRARVLRFFFPEEIAFPEEALRHVEPLLVKLLELNKLQHSMFKVVFVFNVEFVKIDEEGKLIMQTIVPIRAKSFIVMPIREVLPHIMEATLQIMETIDKFLQRGSGWTVNDILTFDVEIAECKPMVGSCGLHKTAYMRARGIEFLNRGFKQPLDDDAGGGSCEDVMGVLSEKEEETLMRALGEGEQSATKKQSVPLGKISARYSCFYLAIASHFVAAEAVGRGETLGEEENEKRCWDFIRERIDCSVPVPVHLEDVGKFEASNANKLDLSVNIVYDDGDGLFPVYASPHVKAKNIVVLTLGLSVDEHNGREMHFARVEDPDSLFAPRRVHAGGKTRKIPAFFCWNCFNFQQRKESHERHISWCHLKGSQMVQLPKPGQVVKYDEGKIRSRASYLLFFDFETLSITPSKSCSCSESVLKATRERNIKPTEREMEDFVLDAECEQNLDLLEQDVKVGKMSKRAAKAWKKRHNLMEKHARDSAKQDFHEEKMCEHKTKILKIQPAFAYNILLLDRSGKVLEDLCYVGEDAAVHFLSALIDLEDKYLEPLGDGGAPMEELSPHMEKLIEKTKICYICESPLGGDKVRDHDHMNGKFLGVAHNYCNLKRREFLKIHCFAHNFSGYDSHLIVRALNQLRGRVMKLAAIPLNTQKFKMLSFNRIVMLDSAAFLGDSLDNLVNTLVSSDHTFPILATKWSDKSERELMIRKGVFPYGFCESIELLQNTTNLPPKEAFFNEIGDVDISIENYAHAERVWDRFHCKTMIDYTRLYVKTDTYLLAEVVMDLRAMILNDFDLEISNYLSLPMLAKDIMLKKTGVEMELIADQVCCMQIRRNKSSACAYVGEMNASHIYVEETTRASRRVTTKYLLQTNPFTHSLQEMSNLLQSNIRGGLSFINTRYYDTAYPHAGAELVGESSIASGSADALPEEEASPMVNASGTSIAYLDANNLYGKAMSFPLPLRDFRWMSEEEISAFDVASMVTEEEGAGYILEVIVFESYFIL